MKENKRSAVTTGWILYDPGPPFSLTVSSNLEQQVGRLEKLLLKFKLLTKDDKFNLSMIVIFAFIFF